ncbi:dihydropteroate synthase [Paracidobacterium acidisoli]|uniref:dihydropteroate synthase n=1 Tax=Paracidobacterium acidisoli TaxID=2303751 RepID=A0A372ING9_9BACT|nr:dihydropteroate synthase [Paracidobacterium acidisoli]MBT9332109.1 dihydropteroate synthase [Paracidobacterium acidisoli]
MAFIRREEFIWRLRSRFLRLGVRTLVMGVLNVTPDSFSDGNRFLDPDAALHQALRIFDEGADILDIGGESTRPGARNAVTAQQEMDRVLPVIEALLRVRPESVISIDTYKAATARAAVHAGAEIVNDVSGFMWDEDMAAACAGLNCGVVLMHTRGRPDNWRTQPRLEQGEVVPLVKRDLAKRLASALAAGVAPDRIVLDPGYGFGKTFGSNYPLLAHLDALRDLGRPLLAGVSRKSFLARALAGIHGGEDPPMSQRGAATIAATTAVILGGAQIVRVHDVRPAVEAACIADAILAEV